MNNLSPAPGHRFFLLTVCLAAALLIIGCSTPMPGTGYPDVTITAHRGGAALAPENTAAAFTRALELDADSLELDIRLSLDGELVVIHDAALERTTGAEGLAEEYTADELARLDASKSYTGPASYPPQPVPRLSDILDLVQEAEAARSRPIGLQIEIKVGQNGARYPAIEEKLVTLLTEREIIETVTVISFDFPTLTRIRELAPDLRTAALISTAYMSSVGSRGPAAVADEMEALGVDAVGINYRFLSGKLYDELRSRGLGVGVWTVNDAKNMEKFAAMGVDFITSDNPDLLRRILRGQQQPVSAAP
jgi:glycerophosphoryl diester phosphodiesterase